MKNLQDAIKYFGMNNQFINAELEEIEKTFSIELGHIIKSSGEKDQTYYPQFDNLIRLEAKLMAEHYETFYCLEKSIRILISETLEELCGVDWWESGKIPESVYIQVKKNFQKEKDSGITLRSQDSIDYTNFGELGEIIIHNWDIFGSIFNSRKALGKVLNNLNSLRNPIAHCSPLAEDEIKRLEISVRDWFRLME